MVRRNYLVFVILYFLGEPIRQPEINRRPSDEET